MQKMNFSSSSRKASTDHAYLATVSSGVLSNVNSNPSSSHSSICNELGGSCDYYYSDDIWSTNAVGELLCMSRISSKYVFFDVFLPSGFLIPIQCPTYRTLKQLKQDVFIQAKRFL